MVGKHAEMGKRMIRPQMTPEEVRDRLADGEDALDLSIEHWEINVERWMDESVDILEECYGSQIGYAISPETCGLCTSNRHFGRGCTGCPYYNHYGYRCYVGHYGIVEDLVPHPIFRHGNADREKVVNAAVDMLNALKVIRVARMIKGVEGFWI